MLAALTQPRGPAAGPGSEPGSEPAAANGAIASWTSFDDPSPAPGPLAHASASYEDPNPYPAPKAYPGAPASTSYPDERAPADANPFQGPQTAASLPSSPTAYGRAYGRTARRSLEAGAWAAMGSPSAPNQAPGGAAEPAQGPSPDPARDPAARPDAGLPAPDQALQGAGSLGGAESGLRDAEEAGSESSRLVLPGIARCAPWGLGFLGEQPPGAAGHCAVRALGLQGFGRAAAWCCRASRGARPALPCVWVASGVLTDT